MVFELDSKIWFPQPQLADENGLLAVGGDLSVDRLLLAYSYGIFPWYSFNDSEEILWYCPHERFVIFPNEIHISHSMRTMLNHSTSCLMPREGARYRLSMNEDFEGVIRNCSKLRYEEEGAWLGEDMIEAYTEMHRQGFATSVEVWDMKAEKTDGEVSSERQEEEEKVRGKLVGGLYGVTLAKYFIGESMFSLVPSGSKLALIFLALFMQKMGGSIIDCQLHTPHLESMGGRFISYDEYLQILNQPYNEESV
ncbi:MAG: leucyl/phenylalanyl-tRNA--protein transferase [Prevotella sp.]|nr:leucyl/phenylalanyl-tRNA--protein transferase [Prevotella sp.]